jgi:tripartite-type tricarboxylate transporter receptor subunit TctC
MRRLKQEASMQMKVRTARETCVAPVEGKARTAIHAARARIPVMTGHFSPGRGIAAVAAAATLAIGVLMAGVPAATAQTAFPERTIRIVMPIPAGSALDVVARIVAERMSSDLGRQVIVEDRPGALGLIAVQAVSNAPADGYTLLGGAASIFTILPAQNDKPAIDVNHSFRQIGMIAGSTPMHLAVPPRLGVSSFQEFAALARSKPGEIFIGSNGVGTVPYYAGLSLAKAADLQISIVPYTQGGTPAAIGDIMGGRLHGVIEGAFGLRGALQAGDLRLIGAMSLEPDPLYPEETPIAATIPGFSAVGFMSLAAPAATPEPIVLRLNEALNRALQAPQARARLDELGVPVSIMTPAAATAYIEAEEKIWWPLVRELETK